MSDAASDRPRQLVLRFPERPAMGQDDFLIADCNREAAAWIERWPDWPAPVLSIHGPAGCGKTHLGRIFAQATGGRWIDGSTLAAADPASLAAPGTLSVDGASAVAGLATAETNLFHLHNMMREVGGFLLLLDREPPARWKVRLPDLRSRLRAAPAVSIGPPDDHLLAAVLVKLFADRQLRVAEDVVRYMVVRMERSFDVARRLVEQIDHATLAQGKAVTIPLIRQYLS